MSDDLRYDILNREFLEFQREVRQLLTQTTLGDSSITRGRLRVASNEGLLVQGSQKVEGWLVVTGTERVTGLLDVQGRLEASGAMLFTGPMMVRGATGISGDLTIAGNTDITGDVALKGTMSVDGGHVQVGDMTLSEAQGGSIEAPLQIVLKSSIVEVQSGIHVEQGAIFDGGITAPSLIPIALSNAPAGAYVTSVLRDAFGRLRVVVPD